MSKKILVIRFSAMGDVALTAPVISSVLEHHKDLEIVFLSRPLFEPFFQPHERLTFVGADLKGKHKGVLGLKKLQKELLHKNNFDAVIDLHDVLRSKILRTYFKANGLSCYSIDKGRKEKKALINGQIPFKKLKHTTQRYLDVFEKIGLTTNLKSGPWLHPESSSSNRDFLNLNDCQTKNNFWIGIAPFAAHNSKEWSIEKVKNVIAQLTKANKKVFLFGGGVSEIKQLEGIQKQFPMCIVVAGKLKLRDELSLISRLDVMVSMDSSNMHLATLVGTKVVSVWGATHHYLGFGPLNNEANIVEAPREDLPCRPCSVYGKLKSDKDRNCASQAMELITEEMVIEKINSILD